MEKKLDNSDNQILFKNQSRENIYRKWASKRTHIDLEIKRHLDSKNWDIIDKSQPEYTRKELYHSCLFRLNKFYPAAEYNDRILIEIELYMMTQQYKQLLIENPSLKSIVEDF